MRFINKYKLYPKLRQFLDSTPVSRILKFKATKWKKLQELLKRKRRLYFKFINYSKVRFNTFRVERIRSFFKESLLLKKELTVFYGHLLRNNYFKQPFNKKYPILKSSIIHGLIKPLFILDIFLWKFGIFESAMNASQSIFKKQVLINNYPSFSGYNLKKGDIITFSIFPKIPRLISFYTYLEVDFYLKKIIILKSLNSLNNNDISLILKRYIDLKKFIHYIKLK